MTNSRGVRTVTRCLALMILTLALGFEGAAAQSERLQTVAAVDQAPGNITITPRGDIIVSLHQFYDPTFTVARLGMDNRLRPFPDKHWAGGSQTGIALDTVLGLQSDTRGTVWMLDNGRRGGTTPKLVAWDTRAHELERVIHLPPPVTVSGSFVNDLAIDQKHRAIYIADPAPGEQAALIVVDLVTGYARRVLEGHQSVVAEDMDLIIDGKPVELRSSDGGTLRPRIGVNPIALDGLDEWLYFGPMHGSSLYRVRTRDLLDTRLTDEELGARVERYSEKPICDGISIDRRGNVYVSDIANHAVGVIDPAREYRILVRDERLSWPDAFSFGPDGMLYTVANQLQRSAVLNAGEQTASPPFLILRIDPLAPGIPGR